MTKKVCRVFWSYNVQKTEKWLEDMAKKGYILVSVDFNLRLFKFERKSERELIYRIVYSEGGNSEIPKGLAQSGWIKVVESKSWSILINAKPFNSIESFYLRQGIIDKNEKVKYITGALFSITLMINIILIVGIIKYVTDITVAEKILILVKITFINRFTILGSISLYIFLKIRSSNKKLNIENNLLSGSDTSLEKEEVDDKRIERKLKSRKKIVMKLGWMHSPDKMEQWLESMEMKGFNLYKVGKMQITFFFVKAAPRKVKYCVDYQKQVSEEYFNINKDAGWKLNSSSFLSSGKWSIWSKEYIASENPPQMYTDNSEKVEHAKKVARRYLGIYIPMIIMYISISSFDIWTAIEGNRWPKSMIFMIIIFLICIIEFGIFTINSIKYYFRIKNSD